MSTNSGSSHFVDTDGWNEWPHYMDVPHTYHRNEPTSYEVLETLVSHNLIDVHDHLVDMGCGKGRVLFYISEKIGCRVTGVEYNPIVYQALEQNLQDYSRLAIHKPAIHIKNLKAEDYRFQPDQSVLYFFNPFGLSIFKKVIGHLIKSVMLYPRELNVILYYPDTEQIEYLKSLGCFYFEDSLLLKNNTNYRERIDIFRYLPI